MLSLRDLIIQRIEQANQLASQLDTLTQDIQVDSFQSEYQFNRALLRVFSSVRHRQKQRIQRQIELLQQTKTIRFWQNRVIEEFLSISFTIFTAYDSSFVTILESGTTSVEKLQRIYSRFGTMDHPKQLKKHILMAVNGDIIQSTPFVLLSYVCEWSRNRLGSQLQRDMAAEFQRHEQQLKRFSLKRKKMLQNQKSFMPLSISTNVQKTSQTISLCTLTNKESVFGLLLDELNQFYKSMPLELDFGFIKGLRRIHSKGNQFEREDNLSKAVEILIESKNKHIKEEMEIFRKQYQQKHPSVNRENSEMQSQLILRHSQSKLQKETKKKLKTKNILFQRVKSQSESPEKNNEPKGRQSFLLCPKATEISFQNSKEIISQLRKQRQKKELQLPEIMQNRNLGSHSKSTSNRKKAISFLAPVSKSLISNYEKILLKSSDQVNIKNYEFKQPHSIEKAIKKKDFSFTNEVVLKIAQAPQAQTKKIESDQFKKNRKLMLQLLRQKKKHLFLEK